MAQYKEASWIIILMFLLCHGFYADCASVQAAIRGRKTLGIDNTTTDTEAAPVGLTASNGCNEGWNNCRNTGYGGGSHEGSNGGDGSGYDSGGYGGGGSGGDGYSKGGASRSIGRGWGSIGSGQAGGYGRPGYGSGGGKGDNNGGNGP